MFVDRCLFLCPFVFGVVIVCPSLPTGQSATVDTVFTCNQIHISQVKHNNKEETDDYKAWEHKISLTYIYVSVTCTIYCICIIVFWRHWYVIIPPLFIEVPESNQRSEQSCAYVCLGYRFFLRFLYFSIGLLNCFGSVVLFGFPFMVGRWLV